MPPLLFLDLDGTLIDSESAVRWALDGVMAEQGQEPVSDAEYYAGRHAGVMYAFSERGMDVDACYARYRILHDQEAIARTSLFPGAERFVAEALSAGYRVATITMRLTRVAEDLLDHLGMRDHFELVAGQDWPSKPKPDPAHGDEAMVELGVTADQCLWIGDTDLDAGGAAACAIPFLGVTWGSCPSSDLQPNAALVDTFAELREQVARLRPTADWC